MNAERGRGPSPPFGRAARLSTIIAGVDLVALDYWASKYILMQEARLKGHRDLSRMDTDYTDPRALGAWLRLSAGELVDAVHAVALDEDGMNVHVRELKPILPRTGMASFASGSQRAINFPWVRQ